MTKDQAFARMAGECSKNEICSCQAKEKLERWMQAQKNVVLVQSDIEEIIQRLVSEKFIDDSRFAGAYVRDKYKFYGWGPRKVKFQLKRLGIADNVVNEVIDGESILAEETFQRVMGEKISELKRKSYMSHSHCADTKDTYKEKQQFIAKVLRFGMSRGFDTSAIMKLLYD